MLPDPSSWAYVPAVIAASIAIGYLLGSVSFGLMLTRIFGMGDLRDIGSGNIGATNVLRTGNKALAAATLAGDMLKGTCAVLIARKWGLDAASIAGFSAFIGHLFPVWLNFRGGKGVATYIGVLLGIWSPGAAIFTILWLVIAGIWRISSLAALVASSLMPLILVAFAPWPAVGVASAMSVLVFFTHSQNIDRLMNGEEPTIGGSG